MQAHWLWKDEKFTKAQAWLDLLMSACYQPSEFTANGVLISLERGDIGMSQLTMAERWGWSRGRVKRFLNDLEKHQMAVQRSVQRSVQGSVQRVTVVSICNYSKYQGIEGVNGTTHDTTPGTTGGAYSRSKEDKNNTMGDFDVFWKAYPNKRGKDSAKKKWAKLKPEERQAAMTDIADRVTRDDQWARGYIPKGSTYVNGKLWEDEVTPNRPSNEPMPRSMRGMH